MIALKELAFLINEGKVSSLHFTDLLKDKDVKSVFYQGLLSNEFDDDDEAAALLYKKTKSSPVYKKLKKEFKKDLINRLFFIDVNHFKYSDRQKAYYKCHKDWAAMKILLGQNGWTSARKLCIKVYKMALQYEFTDIITDVARTLRLYYGTREGNKKAYEKYALVFDSYRQLRDREEFVEGLYIDLIVSYVNKRSDGQIIQQKAYEYFKLIEEDLATYDSYWIRLCGYLIQLFIFSSVKDQEGTLTVCSEAIAFFNKKAYKTNTAMQVFLYQKMVSFAELNDYEEGKLAALEGMKMVSEGTGNWFKYQEWFFLFSMHMGDYRGAFTGFLKVKNHKRFKFLLESNQELWRIYEAFLYLLWKTNRLGHGQKAMMHFGDFKPGRFFNALPVFERDKRGMNIPILIAQVLLMLINKDYHKAIGRIEALNKYCSRYLTKNETFRSNSFIKMLIQIPASGFHRVAVERKTKKYYAKLMEVPYGISNQNLEIEIIPYEKLWKMALELMGNKIYRPRKKKSSARDNSPK